MQTFIKPIQDHMNKSSVKQHPQIHIQIHKFSLSVHSNFSLEFWVVVCSACQSLQSLISAERVRPHAAMLRFILANAPLPKLLAAVVLTGLASVWVGGIL